MKIDEKLIKESEKICFLYKDILQKRDSFTLDAICKNTVTKVFAIEENDQKPIVFLVSPSFYDKKRLLEIVCACLKSINKEVKTNIEISLEEVKEFSLKIFYSYLIEIKILDNSICCIMDNEVIKLLDVTEVDSSSKNIIARSLCILFAFCGKTVSNNIDNFIINDYGIYSG